MGKLTFVSVEEIRARGSIKDGDVLKLRRALLDDAQISIDDANALFALDDACPVKDPAWADFFVEALADFAVHQMKPEGYVVAEKATWLMSKLGFDGRLRSHIELELLVTVIEAARWSPPSLAAFALTQVRHAVETGGGPLRSGQLPETGAISQAEIDLLRRIVLGFGKDSGIAVTRAEADALMAINQAVSPAKSSPAWTDFFVNAVGNGVLAALGRAVPRREQAFGADDWNVGQRTDAALSLFGAQGSPAPREAETGFGSFGGRAIGGGAGSIWSSCRLQTAEERAMARLERQRLEIVTNERIEEADEAWLMGRLGREGRLNANEMALLAFLQREACGLPGQLSELMARSVIAA